MRQHWKEFESLEAWSRSEPHRLWWQQFLRDSGGTGFWYETYLRRGGVEAVYIDMETPTGMARFAPVVPARGAMFSARTRSDYGGQPKAGEAVTEEEFLLGTVKGGFQVSSSITTSPCRASGCGLIGTAPDHLQ